MPIFDQGYQHWQGTLAPFRWRWLAIARHGVRALLTSKIIRLALIAAWMPAVMLVVILALWGMIEQRAESILDIARNMRLPAELLAKPQDFRGPVWTILYRYFFKIEVLGAIFLVLAVGPGLISRDLRFNALPLYFSRPIRRVDYFIGKLAVIAFFIAATTIVPATVAYLVGLSFSLDLSVFRDTHRLLWGGILYGLIISISAGSLMLALSSLSRRSIYVGIAWAGFCFLTLSISGILIGMDFHQHERGVIHAAMAQWIEKNPPPANVDMNGIYPLRRRGVENISAANRAEIEAWEDKYWTEYTETRRRAENEAGAHLLSTSQWRAVIGYTTNLDRVGDALLGFDEAVRSIGRAIDKPRHVVAPALAIHARGNVPKQLLQSNEELLANTLAWQFPWRWSAYVLVGLWLISIFILSRRVKSLDRLK